MESLPEKDYRELFRISIFLKALDGFFEACAGIFLYFIKFASINAILFSVFHSEVVENPRDTFWGYLIDQWHLVSLSGHFFWGLLFLAHGVTKLFLSVALLKNRIWAYPAAAIVFSLFVGYELYSLAGKPSLFLWLVTIFDMIVVGLIVHEYRYIKKHRAP